MHLIKSHAFGNDFLLIEAREMAHVSDRPGFARDVCDRHRGVGADGLMIFEPREHGASMLLLNADGSRSEVSGNGVRCLAAWLASTERFGNRKTIDIETEAGLKRLDLLDRRENRYTFRAAMGQPESIDRVRIDVGGSLVDAITLRVGNPQCVVLGEVN